MSQSPFPIKHVLITGAGSGIGEATAHEFAAHGFAVTLAGRNLQKLEAAKAQLPLLTSEAHQCLAVDLTSSASIETLVKVCTHKKTLPDVLINNAGCFERNDGLKNNASLWPQVFRTNLFGSVELTELLLPVMIQKKHGVIINVSSTLGLRPVAGTGVYSASKAALWNWTQSLAIEAAVHGIRVNCVSPGLVETPIHSFYHLPDVERSKARESMARIQPLGRIGTPTEVAKAIYFLASEESKWTTGTNLNVDGGINLV